MVMGKFFRARRAGEFRVVLEYFGFYLQATHGDDSIYARQGYGYTVKIPSRDSEEVPMGTADSIKKCIRNCGVDPKDVLKWWKENGYGD